MTEQNNTKNLQSNEDNSLLSNITKTDNSLAEEMLFSLNPHMRENLTNLHNSLELLERRFPELEEDHNWTLVQTDFKNVLQALQQYEALQIRLQTKSSHVNLIELCEKIAATFEDTANDQHIVFSYENNLDNPTPFTRYICDEKKVREALIALLENIFDTTEQGTYIYFKLKNTAENTFTIQIEQDGNILSNTDLKMLFSGIVSKEAFQQHTGILRCQELTDCYHGKFSISSKEKCTQFTLEFPLEKCA